MSAFRLLCRNRYGSGQLLRVRIPTLSLTSRVCTASSRFHVCARRYRELGDGDGDGDGEKGEKGVSAGRLVDEERARAAVGSVNDKGEGEVIDEGEVAAVKASNDGGELPADNSSNAEQNAGQGFSAVTSSNAGHELPAATSSNAQQELPTATLSNVEQELPPATSSNFEQELPAVLSSNADQELPAASPSNTQQVKPEIARGLELLRQKKSDFERIMKTIKPSPSASSDSMAKPNWDCDDVKFKIMRLEKELVRTRFAPSPTGYLHLGSLRTALLNKLTVLMAAKSADPRSAFVLRIEDTDQSRVVEDAERSMMEDLSLAGISWDEGPDCGGPYGPYRQSERLHIYKEHVQTLLDSGHAFRCFCSAEQLDIQKQALHEAGKPTLYVGTCRTIDPAESARRAAEGEPHCVRFRDDPDSPKPTTADDISNNRKQQDVDDFIILKSDGFPTYHLASVVDDHLMKITHVIRGEEWLISTPKHYALYRAFGWTPPIFEHLGLLVKDDGVKISKRLSDDYSLASLQNVDLDSHDPNRGVLPMSMLFWLASLGSQSLTNHPRQMPRSIEDLAKMLPPLNYKRGPIKLNFNTLFDLNGHYRSQLLRLPPHMVTPLEHELLLKFLFAPTYNFIIKNPVVEPWNTPTPPVLELVPILRESDLISTEGWKSTRERTAMSTVPPPPVRVPTAKGIAYMWAVLASRHSFRWSQMVVYGHPYLFWRPPISFREPAMSMTPPDPRVLDALEEVLARDDLWEKPGPLGPDGFAISAAVKGICIAQGVNPIFMHDTLRLVAAGRADCHSHATHFMFELLGRDEWKHRLQTVRELQKQIPADFKPVTRRMEGRYYTESNRENGRNERESERYGEREGERL